MKNCKQCNTGFEVTDEDRQFYEKISPVFARKKYLIPEPTLCPQCRLQRRLVFRNERRLYQRECTLTGKQIISIYSPDAPYKVYDQAEWWSDKWNPMDYGRDFDFSKTLNEQLQELYRDVPHASLYNTNVENSYYTNFALNQKNSYLIFGGGNDEDCMYGKFVVNCKDVVDSLAVYSCELCYEGVASEGCYNCKFFLNCRECKDCLMVEDCTACKDCIGCFNLKGKQYYIFNKQYSKEEYEKIKQDFKFLTQEKIADLRDKLAELKGSLPHIQSHVYASENCTGDNVYNSKNCLEAFDCKDCEDCKYISFAPKTHFSQDVTFCAPDGDRFCYNVCSTVGVESSMACFFVWYGANIYYSLDCHRNNDIFACVGLRSKKYCILNKQYSKEDYENLVAKIIEHMRETGEWGEYFSYGTSPFAYNETIAQEYFPLEKADALKKGWGWSDFQQEIKAAKTIPADRLPDEIKDIPDDILNWAIVCERTGRPFKIVPQELEYYRKNGIPVPRLHPDQRHLDRIALRNVYTLFDRNCAKCQKSIKTSYSPDRPEIVYCEQCYLKEVY